MCTHESRTNLPRLLAKPIFAAVSSLICLPFSPAAQAGQVLFQESFDRCEDGKPPPQPWQVLEGEAVVEKGRLRITSERQNPRVLLPTKFEGDLSVSLRLMRAPECHWSGMVVKDLYWLTVNRQFGALFLNRRLTHVPSGIAAEEVGAELSRFGDWAKYLWDPSSFVMRLDCQGKTLRAYLDNKLFLETQDDRMPEAGGLVLVGGWGTDIYVDDVVVRRFDDDLLPKRAPRAPRPTLEGLKGTLDRQDAIYHESEQPKLTVTWRPREAQPLRLRLRTIDFYERTEGQAEAKVEQVAGQTAQATVAIRPPRRGIFKVSMTLLQPDGQEVPQGDLTSFSVIPKSLGERPESEASCFGGHPHWEVPEFHYALARKIGMRWARDHDAIQYTWWPNVERERGKWHWYDQDVALLRRNRLQLLGEFLYVPDWASSAPTGNAAAWGTSPPKSLDDFGQYVFETVSHYRSAIHCWEVWNEPHYGGFWKGTPEEYAELLRTAYEAAKRADPRCVIVGGGGVDLFSLNWVERAMRAGLLRWCDVFSFHYGCAGVALEGHRERFVEQLKRLENLMREHGATKPLWNTEAAVFSTSFLDQYREGCAEPDAVYHFREAACALVRMYVQNVACGVQKVFYYDVLWPRRDGFIDGFLKDPVATGMIELHGGLKPIGVAYATVADVLDGARFVETIDLSAEVHAYLFQRGSECTAVYWGNFGRQPVQKQLRLRSRGRWELCDVMNVRQTLPSAGEVNLPLSREPRFVVATGATAGDFARAWRRATVRGG